MNDKRDSYASQAVQAALELRNRIEMMAAEHELPDGTGLRAGISCGEVITGMVGTGKSGYYSVIGTPVELAGRIQDLAEAGQILVGPEELIKQLLNGRGGVLNIEGVGGIGKSRLIDEIKTKEITGNIASFEGRALSEGKNLSFHPIIQVIKSWAGITEKDNSAASYQKLSRNIMRIYPELAAEIIPFIITQWGEALSPMNPKRFFIQSFPFLRRMCNYNLAKSLPGLSIFVECASLFMWSGISFKMSRKIWSANTLALSAKNEFEAARKALREADNLVADRKIITIYHVSYIQAKAQVEFSELRSAMVQQKPTRDQIRTLFTTINKLIRLSRKMRSAEITARLNLPVLILKPENACTHPAQ